jgi:hypothetical protein
MADSLAFGTAGIISTPWRGTWNSSTVYSQLDSVFYQGSSYVSIVSNTNVTPGTDNTVWNLLASIGGLDPTLELSVFVPGLFNSSQELIAINVVRAFSLPIHLTGSVGTLRVAPADSGMVFTLMKNGSSIGTITFSQGGTSGTVAMASAQIFAISDVFSIFAPSAQDSAAAGLAVSLLGTKT